MVTPKTLCWSGRHCRLLFWQVHSTNLILSLYFFFSLLFNQPQQSLLGGIIESDTGQASVFFSFMLADTVGSLCLTELNVRSSDSSSPSFLPFLRAIRLTADSLP